MLASLLAALSAAIIAVNVLQTWIAYPQLPDSVPLRFAFNGEVQSRGPRPMIWFIVGLQIASAALMSFSGYAIATKAPGTHGTLTGFLIFTVIFNVMLWRVQMLLISAAKSGESRAPMSGFLLFFGVCFALILIDAFVIG